MFGFRNLDVYKCAVQALPLAHKFAEFADPDTKRQLKRAALSINLNIAEGTGRSGDDQRQFYRIARGSALECAAILDAVVALGRVTAKHTAELEQLLVRIVSMLTKMSAKGEV